MVHNSTVLAQFLKPVPRHEFESLAKRHHKGRKLRSMTCWNQFVAMSVAQLAGRCSLRDIVSNLSAQGRKLYHLGVGSVARSSLARVNGEQPHGLYEELFGPFAVALPRRATASGSATRSTRSTRRPSTCACRCSRGRSSGARRAR